MAAGEGFILQGPTDDPFDSNESLGAYVLRHLDELGDKVIQIYPSAGRKWTARAMASRARAYATVLHSMGVRAGQRVAFVSGCDEHSSPLMLATVLIGAAWSPVNHGFDAGDLKLLLDNLRPRLVFAAASAEERLRSLVGAAALLVLGAGEAWAAFQRHADLAEARAEPAPEAPVEDVRATDAFVMCSSGTTGLPKCVRLTHFNFTLEMHMLKRPDCMHKSDDVMVITSPAYWVTGVIYALFCMCGGPALVYEFGCTEKRLLESAREHKATALFTATNFVLAAAKLLGGGGRAEGLRLRYIVPTGGVMAAEAEREVVSRLGAPALQIYGMTEMNCASGLHARPCGPRSGSSGVIIPYMQCKVVDTSTGRVLPQGETGELCFKGEYLSPGYLNNPEATAEVFDADGWLHTGDTGHVDAEGYIFVSGRIKDIIKYRGVHVSPADVEALIATVPEVLECAVVGVPHLTDQEWPRAYVALRQEARPHAEHVARTITQLVQETLAPHKWLRGGVRFLDALPKSPTGKVSRADIRRRPSIAEITLSLD